MDPDKPTGVLGRIGNAITRARNFTFNTFFLFLLVALIVSVFSSTESVSVQENSALIVNPQGVLVEERTFSNPFDDIWNINYSVPEVEVGEIIRAIELAKQDENIQMIILDLENLGGISIAQADRLIGSIKDFKTSDKNVSAYANFYSQTQYYISSAANEVYLNPMGGLMLEGFGGSTLYFKDLLDRFGLNAHVFRVGDYKEAVEPLLRNNMSEEAKEVNRRLLGGLWQSYTKGIEENRFLEPGTANGYGINFNRELRKTSGDAARAALENNLVDELLTTDQVRVRFGDRVGFKDDEINAIGFQSYLAVHAPIPSFMPNKIAVINIQGPIFLGNEGAGSTSADTAIQLIREARNSEEVVAIVVRVDSPGGSAFASEMIRLELELAQLEGIPVVSSFASVAASGGYWLSATSDHIITEPNSITGSIGVFSFILTAEKGLKELGVHSDGIGTTPFSLGVTPLAGLNEQISQTLQLQVEHGYNQFIELVAKGRNLEKAIVEPVAQGKVWLGSEAVKNGLADELGSLEKALEKAAELAQVKDWSPLFMLKPVDPREAFLAEILKSVRVVSQIERTILSALDSNGLGTVLAQMKNGEKLQALCEVCLTMVR